MSMFVSVFGSNKSGALNLYHSSSDVQAVFYEFLSFYLSVVCVGDAEGRSTLKGALSLVSIKPDSVSLCVWSIVSKVRKCPLSEVSNVLLIDHLLTSYL